MRGGDQPYRALVPLYDRRTRAAYEVMGARWARFLEANSAFREAEPGSERRRELAERAAALGRRSTHAYFVWTKGHTALALRELLASRRAAA